MPDESPRRESNRLSATGLGLQLAVGMAAFAVMGYWIDRKRGGGVLYTLAGVALGILYVMYEMWKLARQISHEKSERSQNKPGQ